MENLIALFISGCIIIFFYKFIKSLSINSKLKRIITDIVSANFDVLFNNLQKAYYKNEYGYVDKNSLIKEIKKFIRIAVISDVRVKKVFNMLVKDLEDEHRFSSRNKRKFIIKKVSKTKHKSIENDVELRICKITAEAFDAVCSLRGVDIENPIKNIDVPINIGVDYEIFVENKLKEKGFETQRTSIVGDQGVDIIAIKNGKKIAIQCKYYTKSVSNKAVQEIVAGANFYACDAKVVITNSYFTKSAKQLAASLGVVLIEYNRIDDIDKSEECRIL